MPRIAPCVLFSLCVRHGLAGSQATCAEGDKACATGVLHPEETGHDGALLIQKPTQQHRPDEPGTRDSPLRSNSSSTRGPAPVKRDSLTKQECKAISAAIGSADLSSEVKAIWAYICGDKEHRRRTTRLAHGCLYLPSDRVLTELYSKIDRPDTWRFVDMLEGSFFPTTGKCPSNRPGKTAMSLTNVAIKACASGLITRGNVCSNAAWLGTAGEPANVEVFLLDGFLGIPELWQQVLEGSLRHFRAPTSYPKAKVKEVKFTRPRGQKKLGVPLEYYVCGSEGSSVFTDASVNKILESTLVLNRAYAGEDTCDGTTWYNLKYADMKMLFQTARIYQVFEPLCDTSCYNDDRFITTTYAPQEPGKIKVVICKIEGGVLGFAYLPPGNERSLYVDVGTLPNGTSWPYNEGDTLTHEMGHYLGLYHTFQGGCKKPGDSVGDTKPEASPYFGCPDSNTPRVSCSGNSKSDPVHNFMDYSDDRCMCQFTKGQKRRMLNINKKKQRDIYDLLVR